MTDIENYMKAVCKMRDDHIGRPDNWSYSCVEDWVLKNGRHWTPAPLPKDVELMTIKECFKNAALLALERPDLTYVEGFATIGLVPVLHAWCVDDEGRVIDPTWPEGGIEYYGVPFDRRWLIRELAKVKYYGFIDDYRRGFPLLRRGVKGFLSKKRWRVQA